MPVRVGPPHAQAPARSKESRHRLYLHIKRIICRLPGRRSLSVFHSCVAGVLLFRRTIRSSATADGPARRAMSVEIMSTAAQLWEQVLQ